MKKRRAAFTLIEMMVSVCVAGVLAGVIYYLSVEALTSFARNISINRSYSDARSTLDHIGLAMQSAGHVPILVDANGAPTSASPAPGIRFYRYGFQPSYPITSGTTAQSSLSVTFASPQNTPTAGDLIAIPGVGFQGVAQSVAISGSTATITFAGTIASTCQPALTSAVNFTSPALYCLDYTQVAFIAVGTQLRYYPRAMNVATNGAAAFNNATNYKVIANLVSVPTSTSQQLPFQLGPSPTITVTVCAEGPDYNKRSSIIAQANTFSEMQVSLASRCPLLLRGPF